MIDLHLTIAQHREMLEEVSRLVPLLEEVATRLSGVAMNGGKILWCGNGGSAADSQHLAAELVGRFTRERRAIASIALTTDTSILTAIGNDYGYDAVFSRQVEALSQPGDALVAISTSGNSPNVLRAMEAARKRGCYLVGFAGRDGGEMVSLSDHCLVIPGQVTARIQEGHILMGHMLCDWIEAAIVGEDHPCER